jgi:hypothetical protein
VIARVEGMLLGAAEMPWEPAEGKEKTYEVQVLTRHAGQSKIASIFVPKSKVPREVDKPYAALVEVFKTGRGVAAREIERLSK